MADRKQEARERRLRSAAPASNDRRPDPVLLRGVRWSAISRRVDIEQRSRERYTPTISVYRWWARRPHAVIGTILDAAQRRRSAPLKIADPFSGGATVAIEAARRGLPTYAQDIHPWATTGLRLTVAPVDMAALDEAARALTERIAARTKELYESECVKHGRSETLHALWVRVARCPDCSHPFHLFPYSLVTIASRRADETYGYFGCTSCGRVTRSKLRTSARRCRCGRRIADADRRLVPNRVARCPHCRATFRPFDTRPVRWSLALVQRNCAAAKGPHIHWDLPADEDRAAARHHAHKMPSALQQLIPAGEETAVLREAGYRRWRDLYTPRQLALLLAAVDAARALPVARTVRARLLLAICGSAEMAGHLSRWDRYYPKAFEAIANHRFAVVGLTSESNPFGSSGRGTVPRRLAQIALAARWLADELPGKHPVVARSASARTRIELRKGLAVVRGSSERLLLNDHSVDLVLTDPPYFDDVQYAELASLFLTWAHATGLLAANVRVDVRHEAVPNATRGTDAGDYQRLLTRIFGEARRVLRPSGAMVLTFHNTNLRAWLALGQALRASDFGVAALAVVNSENRTDHAKRGHRGFTKDLVIECRPGQALAARAIVRARDAQDRELLALGRAVATAEDLDTFRALVAAGTVNLKDRRVTLPRTAVWEAS